MVLELVLEVVLEVVLEGIFVNIMLAELGSYAFDGEWIFFRQKVSFQSWLQNKRG